MLRIIASAWLVQVIDWHILEVIGRASLGILVLHKFPIVMVQAIPCLKSCFISEHALLMGFSVFVVSAVSISFSLLMVNFIRRYGAWIIGE